jgi:RNA-directed DNA polymerase
MGQWRRAGVMEDGVLRHPASGVGPGGLRSPVLAHIFLHQVLDEWCEREVRPRLQGRCFLTRFADDVVIGGEREADARRLLAVLPQRCARSGFTSHPSKTTLMAFRKPATQQGADPGNGTFDCLGGTHDGTKSPRGDWVSTRRTARKRLRRTKKAWWRWWRAHRQAPLKDQYRLLCLKLRGHCQSYGMRGNFRLRDEVRR